MAHPGGAPRKFKTPEDLWNAYEDYKAWAHKHPWCKKHPLKDGTIIDIEHERPLTLWEFASFLKMSFQGLENYGIREDHKQFFEIYARIRNEIRSFQISGAMCDIYNPSLTARINGISDKQEVEHSGLPTPPATLQVEIVTPKKNNASK